VLLTFDFLLGDEKDSPSKFTTPTKQRLDEMMSLVIAPSPKTPSKSKEIKLAQNPFLETKDEKSNAPIEKIITPLADGIQYAEALEDGKGETGWHEFTIVAGPKSGEFSKEVCPVHKCLVNVKPNAAFGTGYRQCYKNHTFETPARIPYLSYFQVTDNKDPDAGIYELSANALEMKKILPDFSLAQFESLDNTKKAEYWATLAGIQFQCNIWHFTKTNGESQMNVKQPVTLLESS